ncbi:MAG: hypothetical protein RR543_00670 [Erysipelotrichales bacterium]
MKKISLLLILVLLVGCNGVNKTNDDYDLAILNNSGTSSQIDFIKGDKIESSKRMPQVTYPYSESTLMTYNKKHNKIFSIAESPTHHTYMTQTDIKTKESKRIKVQSQRQDRYVSDIISQDDYVYILIQGDDDNILQNYDRRIFFIKYNIETNKKEEVILSDYADSRMSLIGDKIYFVDNGDNNTLIELDPKTMKAKEYGGLKSDVYFETIENDNNGNIYLGGSDLASGEEDKIDYIYQYNLKTQRSKKIEIGTPYITDIKYKDNKLYLTHNDFSYEKQFTKLSVYNLKDNTKKTIDLDGVPSNLSIGNDKVYLYLRKFVALEDSGDAQSPGGCGDGKISTYQINNKNNDLKLIEDKKEINNKMCFGSLEALK